MVAAVMAEMPVEMGRVGGGAIAVETNAACGALSPAIQGRNGKVVPAVKENQRHIREDYKAEQE